MWDADADGHWPRFGERWRLFLLLSFLSLNFSLKVYFYNTGKIFVSIYVTLFLEDMHITPPLLSVMLQISGES